MAADDTALRGRLRAVAGRRASLLSKSSVDSLLPTEKALGEFQGRLEIAPWTVAPLGFWYNRDILTKAGLDPAAPPKTLDQLTTAMARIKSAEPDVIPLGL